MKNAVVTGASSGMGREFVYAPDRGQEFDEPRVIARREGAGAAGQASARQFRHADPVRAAGKIKFKGDYYDTAK